MVGHRTRSVQSTLNRTQREPDGVCTVRDLVRQIEAQVDSCCRAVRSNLRGNEFRELLPPTVCANLVEQTVHHILDRVQGRLCLDDIQGRLKALNQGCAAFASWQRRNRSIPAALASPHALQAGKFLAETEQRLREDEQSLRLLLDRVQDLARYGCRCQEMPLEQGAALEQERPLVSEATRQDITDALRRGPLTTKQLVRHLGLSRGHLGRVLPRLAREGVVVLTGKDGASHLWSLPSGAPAP